MNWQLLIVIVILAIVAFIVVRGAVRMVRGKSKGSCACHSGCGNCPLSQSCSDVNKRDSRR